MRRNEPGAGFGRKDAQRPKHILNGKLSVPRPGHLVPAAEKATDGVVQMKCYIMSRFRHRTIGKVGGPSPHRAVQVSPHLLPRRLIAGPKPLSDAVLDGGNGPLGRLRPIVASTGSRRVHGAEGVAEEVEGLASDVAHTRLLLVQCEPNAGHPPRVASRTSAAPCRQRITKSSAYVTSTAPYRRSRAYLRNALMKRCI